MRAISDRFVTLALVLFTANLAFAKETVTTTTTVPKKATTTTTCPKKPTTTSTTTSTTTTVKRTTTTTTSTTTTTLPPVSHQPPPANLVTVFGPEDIKVGFFGSTSYSASFNGLSQTPEPGELLVTLGGDDKKCGNHPKFLCWFEQAFEIFRRPDRVEIILNGQTVLKQHGYRIIQKYDQVNVTVKAINQLQVKLKGIPFSDVIVEIKSQGAVQHPNPIASYTFSPSTGIAPQLFTFNALTSNASGATISSYNWNFGDGQVDSGSIVVHNFLNPGTFAVKLTVTDSLGGIGTTTQNVVAKANQLPISSFVATAQASNGLALHFDGSASTDSDGNIVSYAWNFGDGQTGSGVTIDHTYSLPATYAVSLTVTDDKNGSTTQTQQIVVRDTIPPVLSLQSPGSGSTIQSFNILVSGSSNKALSALTAQLDGESLINITLGADQKSFSQTIVAGHAGARVLTVIAKDLSGNSTTAQVNFNIVVNLPPVANLKITEPSSNVAPLMVMFDASSSSSPQGKTLHYQYDFGDGNTANSTNGIVSHLFATAGSYTITMTVTDSSNISAQAMTVVTTIDPVIPPPAASQAPALSSSTPQAMVDTIRFLYSGTNPVQTNVQAGAIDPNRVAVLQGTVVDVNDNPISGVKITVLEMPQIGQTLTDANGNFHIVANGGGTLTVTYERNGYFSIQRKLATTALDYFTAAKIVMLQPDPKVTQVTLGSSQIQTVKGSTVSDSSGSRTSVLILPAGTTASLQMPDGTTKQVGTLSLRTTEYTVGAQGPSRMPADLPPTTSYTYAEDISADEAIANGASHVVFSNPVPHYVDNFLNFPVGTAVPYGYYDYTLGAWSAEKDGVVIKVLDVQNGQAVLDMDGNGAAATSTELSQINMTMDELSQIASLYTPGKTFWRVQVRHLSPVDLNFLSRAFPSSNIYTVALGQSGLNTNCDCPVLSHGSIINVNQMGLGEVLNMPGIPSQLSYNSITKSGYVIDRSLSVPLINGNLADGSSLTNVHLHIEAAGQTFDQDFVPQNNLSFVWTWDGKDAFGRTIEGSVNAKIAITYYSPSLYLIGKYVVDAQSFGQAIATWLASEIPSQQASQFTRTTNVAISNQKYKNALDIGGWNLSQVHSYDPLAKRLYLGTGSIIDTSMLSAILVKIAGNDSPGFSGDGDYASNAQFNSINAVAVGPDSSIYIYDGGNFRIRKIFPDGTVNTIVGNGINGQVADGALGINSPLSAVGGIAVGSDGTLYFSMGTGTIEKLTTDGYISRVAGTGDYNFSGDGGPALQAQFRNLGSLALGSDGSLYVVDLGNARIRKITPDGIINTIAGNGIGDSTGDEGSALSASIYAPSDIAIGPNKEIYLNESSLYQIRVITDDGVIHHFAGVTNSSGFSGDEGPAAQAQFSNIRGMDVSADGTVYVGDPYNYRIRSITPDHIAHTIAGTTSTPDSSIPFYTNAQAAFQGGVYASVVKVYNKDKILFANGSALRAYEPALPSLSADGYSIASQDGSEIYQFSPLGIHLQTLYAKTGALKWSFAYDQSGHLVSMTDGNGNITTINRDGNGLPQSMTGPFGQVATMTTTADGYLASVTTPAGETTAMSYSSGGLLSQFKKPKGNSSTFTYNSNGELAQDTDAAGGFKSLLLSVLDTFKYSITQTTAMGRRTQLTVDTSTPLSNSYSTIYPNGRRVDQQKTPYESDINDYGGYFYNGFNLDIDPRLGGMTQFYDNQNWSNNGSFSVTTNKISYTPLSTTDFFKYIEQQNSTNGSMTVTTIYNSAQKTTNSVTGLGRSVSSTIDNFERPVRVTNGNLLPVQYAYTNKGQLASIQQGSRVTQFTYNSLGQLQSVTDPLGEIQQYTWDVSGRLTQAIRPDGKQINYDYDANSNLTSFQPPDKLVHSFASNILDLFSVYTPPSVGVSTSESYLYNLDQQLTQQTKLDGSTIQYSYDSATGNLTNVQGILKSIAYQSGDDSASYPETSQTSDGVQLFVQSQADLQLNRTYQFPGPVQGGITYTYGEQFRLNQIQILKNSTDPNSGIRIAMGYDNDSVLTSAGDLQISRDTANGIMTSNLLGSVQEAFSYNQYGEAISDSTTINSNALFSEQYTRDKLGRITTKVENILGTSTTYAYIYDLAGRLTDVSTNGVASNHYTYDSNGNRLSLNSTTATYDAQDRISQYGNTNYTFDANGNLTQKQNGTDVTKYQYDDFGQLAQVNLPNGHVITYLIDGDVNRVVKILDGVTTKKFIYHANGQIAAEMNLDNTLKTLFIYGTQSNSPDYMAQGSIEYRFVKDQLGSIRFVVNTSDGAVVQRLDYDEFGNISQDTNPGFQPFGFAGGLYDPDTKLVRFGTRDYDSEIGRWTTKDPLGFGGGDTNVMAYVGNDPINSIDPTGLWGITFTAGASLGGAPLKSGYGKVGEVSSGIILGTQNSGFVVGGITSAGKGDHIQGLVASAGLNLGIFRGDVSSQGGKSTSTTYALGPLSITVTKSSNGLWSSISAGLGGRGAGLSKFTTNTDSNIGAIGFDKNGLTTVSGGGTPCP